MPLGQRCRKSCGQHTGVRLHQIFLQRTHGQRGFVIRSPNNTLDVFSIMRYDRRHMLPWMWGKFTRPKQLLFAFAAMSDPFQFATTAPRLIDLRCGRNLDHGRVGAADESIDHGEIGTKVSWVNRSPIGTTPIGIDVDYIAGDNREILGYVFDDAYFRTAYGQAIVFCADRRLCIHFDANGFSPTRKRQ